MTLTDKTEKRIIGDKKREVTVIIEPLTKEEAREMYYSRPYDQHSESRFGQGNTMSDDFTKLLNGISKRCYMCQAPTIKDLLKENICPDCDGRSEYHGKDPRAPTN